MTFSRIQLLFVFLLFSGISNHVLIVPQLLGVAKRDAWIAVIFAYLILFIWIYILALIFSKKEKEQSLFRWVKLRVGYILATIFNILFFMYFFTSGFLAFFDLIASIKIYFMPLTATWFFLLPFSILCVWTASKGMKAIVYVSAIVLPIVWILGHFVAISTFQNKDYSYLFPLFADENSSIIHGIIIILGGSTDFLVLFLLQQYFNKPISYFYLLVLALLLGGLTLGPTMGSIATFGPSVASDLRFPAFEQWRIVTLGEHISHVDFLALFQMISGGIIRVSLCMFFIPKLFCIQSKVFKNALLIIVGFVFSILMIIHISDIWMQTVLKMYYYPSAFIFGVVATILLLIISFFPEKKGIRNIC